MRFTSLVSLLVAAAAMVVAAPVPSFPCLDPTSAECLATGAGFGDASDGPCVDGTQSSCIGIRSIGIRSIEFPCLDPESPECLATGAGFGDADSGACVDGTQSSCIGL
ncbi:hypothetical protein DL96DRAFT_1820330 [Flagelloscypha sp. PMI_526]|nr:hypothetical protein DL96DRAFT_1820330 [Flagelloscypha sp. PMI_526]